MNTPEIMCTLTVHQILHEESLVKSMYSAGMRSVRINTAHLMGVDMLGDLARKLKAMMPDVRILIDTKGPEMRTTSTLNSDPIKLREGESVTLQGDKDKITSPECIYVNYPDLHKEVKASDILLIDDGKLSLKVTDVEGANIHAQVMTGGELGSKKGIAVAGVNINLPPVSEHDCEYIAYAAKSNDIDLIAHSFVRSKADVAAVKEAMSIGKKPVIAKIENQQGIDNLADIIREADAVLIARGDLSVSIGKDNIPAAQAKIAKAVKEAGKPLYLATNILPSMMASTEPSSDDISRIHTAINQGVDVMLLTNETAAGPYPAESVNALANITRSIS